MQSTIREEIVKVAKIMYDKQMVNAYEGNISVKDGDRIYITPSGICKGYLTEDMLVVMNAAGGIIEGKHAPSSEFKMHLECYKLRSDITSVVHNHSAYATAYAIANKPIESRAYGEMMIAFDKIPVIPYGTPSTEEIYAGLSEYIDKADVFLLGNHGVVSVGSSLFDAFFKIEAAEAVAKTLTIAKSVGEEAAISDEQIEILYQIRKEKFGRDRML